MKIVRDRSPSPAARTLEGSVESRTSTRGKPGLRPKESAKTSAHAEDDHPVRVGKRARHEILEIGDLGCQPLGDRQPAEGIGDGAAVRLRGFPERGVPRPDARDCPLLAEPVERRAGRGLPVAERESQATLTAFSFSSRVFMSES